MKHEYQITGMTCQSCVENVRQRLSQVKGITHAQELQKALKDTRFNISERAIGHELPKPSQEEATDGFLVTYRPIILVFAFILGVTLLNEWTADGFDLMRWMRHFMAGFFLVFSFFKLLDLPAFASSYSTYDVLARKWFSWGYIYPIVELTLGILFLVNFQPLFTNIVTFIIMALSSIGVVQSLMKKRKIKCACLGAVFNLPMSSITLTEDLLMVIMSGYMILHLS